MRGIVQCVLCLCSSRASTRALLHVMFLPHVHLLINVTIVDRALSSSVKILTKVFQIALNVGLTICRLFEDGFLRCLSPCLSHQCRHSSHLLVAGPEVGVRHLQVGAGCGEDPVLPQTDPERDVDRADSGGRTPGWVDVFPVTYISPPLTYKVPFERNHKHLLVSSRYKHVTVAFTLTIGVIKIFVLIIFFFLPTFSFVAEFAPICTGLLP